MIYKKTKLFIILAFVSSMFLTFGNVHVPKVLALEPGCYSFESLEVFLDRSADNPVVGTPIECFNDDDQELADAGDGRCVYSRPGSSDSENITGVLFSCEDEGVTLSPAAATLAQRRAKCLEDEGEWDEAGGKCSLNNDCDPEGSAQINKENCGIIKYLVMFINVLSAIAGIVIVGSIVAAGIQYSSGGSEPHKISAAKNRIRNAIIALLFFLFGYALLNYLIPGGVL